MLTMNEKEILHVRKALGVTLDFDKDLELDLRVKALESYCSYYRINMLLAISGGQDSALAGYICKKVNERNSNIKFYTVQLPYGEQRDISDSNDIVEWLQPTGKYWFNIKEATDFIAKDMDLSDFDKGNVKARQRMVVQYALASKLKAIVIGTDHASEALMGFYTKYGDGGVDYTPLTGLTKKRGLAILQATDCPIDYAKKAPTADLLDNKPQQKDEDEMGLTYEDLETFLTGEWVDIELLDVSKKEKIVKTYCNTQHKREMPIAPIMSDVYKKGW